jgi:hypothetical protein
VKRRFATHYYVGNGVLYARGAAATVKGAIRATVVRVFMREYGGDCWAVIHDRELQIDLMVVRVGRNGLDAVFTPEALALQRNQPRRVK